MKNTYKPWFEQGDWEMLEGAKPPLFLVRKKGAKRGMSFTRSNHAKFYMYERILEDYQIKRVYLRRQDDQQGEDYET